VDHNSIKSYYGPPAFNQPWQNIDYLNEKQLKILTAKFRDFCKKAPGPRVARIRGRYFLIFLFLRYTGARISEVTGIDDQADVDYRAGTAKLFSLFIVLAEDHKINSCRQ